MAYRKSSCNTKRVLLIFGNSRAGLAIARSLSEMGAKVHNVRSAINKTEIDYSNSISKSIYLGNVFSDFYGVLSGLSEILNDFDIVVPANDAAYELSFKLKHLAQKRQFSELPEEKNYRLVSDKFLIHREFSDLFTTCLHLDGLSLQQMELIVKQLDRYEIISFQEATDIAPPAYVPQNISQNITRYLVCGFRGLRGLI